MRHDGPPFPGAESHRPNRRLLAAAVVVAVAGVGYFASGTPPSLPASDAAERTVTPRGELGADEKATIALFEKSRDSVVFISTAQLFHDPWSRNVQEVPRGTGSGFIWDDAGDVVTNFHVIAGASQATVRLADGRDYPATLVGASPSHDIAVLRISVGFRHPRPVPIGTSSDLKVGQKVLAIGNPFGLDWTLTTGIVSALDRSLPSEGGRELVEHLIQTDAPINPGNSGGPLLDSAGRLIGITTAIFSPSGASAGIGFAVPVDSVMRVVPQLIRHGRYTRPTLGIETDEGLNEQLTQMLGEHGVVVLRVTPRSAADRAGLRGIRLGPGGRVIPGDIITAVEGKRVDSVADLLARLDDFKVGDKVAVEVERDGRRETVPVTLQAGS